MSELPPTPPPLPDDAPPPAARTFSSMDQAFLTGQPGTGELILVRHGQQQYPEAGMRKFADWVDPPLSELGRRQAEAVGRALAGRPVAAVYSRPGAGPPHRRGDRRPPRRRGAGR